MIEPFLSAINWIDILVLGILARCIYAGGTYGFIVEFFKFLGMLMATFITLHYYTGFAAFLQGIMFISWEMPVVIAYGILWGGVVLIFKIIRDGWLILFKTETHPVLNKWGGAFLGGIRSIMVCGMMFLAFLLSEHPYLSRTAKASLSGFYLVDFSPSVYNFCYEKSVAKIFSTEKKNEAAFEIKDIGVKKNKKK
ncbi:MAG: CvpA family protein [Candidatus Omnitrophota bacterium]|nr:CvpA family protein [Candidatus Omnitrophota bacterium]MDZ4242545.1 CvpA family protein [Candidatus Omnitrophota bacterium]